MTIQADPSVREARMPNGLVRGHAYTITRLAVLSSCDDTKIIRWIKLLFWIADYFVKPKFILKEFVILGAMKWSGKEGGLTGNWTQFITQIEIEKYMTRFKLDRETGEM